MTGKELIDSVIDGKVAGVTGDYNPEMLSRGPEGLQLALACLYRHCADCRVPLNGLLTTMMAMSAYARKNNAALDNELRDALAHGHAHESMSSLYACAQIMLNHLDDIASSSIDAYRKRKACDTLFDTMAITFPKIQLGVDSGRYLEDYQNAVRNQGASHAYRNALKELDAVSGEELDAARQIKEDIKCRIEKLERAPDPCAMLAPLVDSIDSRLKGKYIFDPRYHASVYKVYGATQDSGKEYIYVRGKRIVNEYGELKSSDDGAGMYLKIIALDEEPLQEVDPEKLLELTRNIAPHLAGTIAEFLDIEY